MQTRRRATCEDSCFVIGKYLVLVSIFLTQFGCIAFSGQKNDRSAWEARQPEVDSDFVVHSLSQDLPVVTSSSDLETFVGKLVIVRGNYIDGSHPEIARVGVQRGVSEGQQAYAIGIVHRYEVTQAEYEQSLELLRENGGGTPPPIPGVYYSLQENVITGTLAKPRPVQSWYSIFGVVLGVK